MNKIIIAVIIIILIIGGIWWFSQSKPSAGEPMPVVTLPDTTTVTTEVSVKEFTVIGQNFSFAPATITVNKGDTVKITFQNAGGTHDWRLDEFNVKTKVLNGGQQETVEFVASQTGSFEYYCSIGNHRAMGMVGTLMVK